MQRPTIAEAVKAAEQALRVIGSDRDEAVCQAQLIVKYVTGLALAEQILHGQKVLSVEQIRLFEEIIEERRRRVPLQYVLGTTGFMGHELACQPGVLIPRPDTETLVQVALARLPAAGELCVLDVGTGSGAIIVSVLAARPQARGVGIDVSANACQLTRLNAESLAVSTRLMIGQIAMQDYTGSLGPDSPGGKPVFDAVLANPPYIEPDQMALLAPEVRDHEPAEALLGGGADGLDSYRCLAQRAKLWLKPGGFIACEVGAGQADLVADIFRQCAWGGIESHFDLGAIARVVVASI